MHTFLKTADFVYSDDGILPTWFLGGLLGWVCFSCGFGGQFHSRLLSPIRIYFSFLLPFKLTCSCCRFLCSRFCLFVTFPLFALFLQLPCSLFLRFSLLSSSHTTRINRLFNILIQLNIFHPFTLACNYRLDSMKRYKNRTARNNVFNSDFRIRYFCSRLLFN